MVIKRIKLSLGVNVTLNECLKVNYFVGPNGSGKTRALLAIDSQSSGGAELYDNIPENPSDISANSIDYEPIHILPAGQQYETEDQHLASFKQRNIPEEQINSCLLYTSPSPRD